MFEKNYKIILLLDFYGDILTDKQKDAIDLYYNEDLSLAEIADHFGITRQGVRDSIKRGEDILLEMEEKLKLAERFTKQRDAFELIQDCVFNIRHSKTKIEYHRIIDENIETIVKTISELDL